MSGAPRVRSLNVDDSESRPVLVPGGNKSILVATTRKPASKPSKKPEGNGVAAGEKKASSPAAGGSPLASHLSAPTALRRHEMLLQSNLSMNASCSSDASTDSSCSRASTGRIGRSNLTSKRRETTPKLRKIVAKVEKTDSDSSMMSPTDIEQGKRRCAWVTPNTEPCYAAFHDEEWGVPVHDDRKLFELLVLSGALAELTWPVILSKRHIFREVFLDFDPVAISKLNEKKILAPGRTASSLLSEPKLRAIIENARQTLKIVHEFGSFDRYCWGFVNQKPVTSRFRYPRQVPVKTPKAEVISKDLIRRGFRSVSATVIYSFMQAAGLTNDHLISCYRFEECVAAAQSNTDKADGTKCQSCISLEGKTNSDKELTVANDLQLSRLGELSISEFVDV